MGRVIWIKARAASPSILSTLEIWDRLSYDFSVKRNITIPVPGSLALAEDLAATALETELSQADVIRQSLKLGMPALRARLGKSPRRRLSLVQHFKRLKGLELPSCRNE